MERCCICGRPLEKSESIERGMGDVCAARLGLFKHKPRSSKDVLAPNYNYHIVEIAGQKVAIVIDNGTGRSVTNSVDFICDEISVKHLVYRDTTENWDYFGSDVGFKSLSLHGAPTTSMDVAIEVARIRYFDDLGGLFGRIVSEG